jgi:polysaccharide export outer membrane protein
VTTPGVHQITGPKKLDEVLALAGGLSKEAGYRITVTREKKWGMIPLPGAAWDPSGEYSMADVDTRQLTLAKDPAQNILIKPNDVITVPHAEVVYVMGEVKKAGGFTLGDRKQVSALEALSLAEGATSTASQGNARILRAVPGSVQRVQIKIDLKKVMQGKNEDMELSANDILYIPDNSKKRAGIKIAEAAIATISGVLIFRGF